LGSENGTKTSKHLLALEMSAGRSLVGAGDRPPKILVEARIVQISDGLWAKLGVGNGPAPARNVTMPLASLLYVLGEPNAVRAVASARAEARVGQTGEVHTGEKMRFLMPTPSGQLQTMATDTPVGTALTVRPLAVREHDILLQVEFTHSQAQRPQKVDPASSLPVGPPIINSQKLINAELHLTPGEPMIAGGLSGSGIHTYTLIRVEVLPNGP
jgi:hypothetical protein